MSENIIGPIKVKYSDGAKPLYQKNPNQAGWDIRSNVSNFVLKPGQRKTVMTGVRFDMRDSLLPIHFNIECQSRPRSGQAKDYGLTVVNSPGTIDEDYTGEVGIILLNTGTKMIPINRFDRIAQLVFSPVFKVFMKVVDEIEERDDRGEEGFGSTGVK